MILLDYNFFSMQSEIVEELMISQTLAHEIGHSLSYCILMKHHLASNAEIVS